MLAKMIAVAAVAAGPCFAQVTDYEAPGNLAATVDPGCIAPVEADAALSPPDLGLGVVSCANAGDYDQAVGLFILMQLRAVYDTRRVTDVTAHQAGQVLSMQVTEGLPAGGQDELQAAFGRFGETGGARHAAFCADMRAAGAPTHDPSWMIQHGMAAFQGIEGDGLVPGYDADGMWVTVLSDYLKCAG
jgi:hypothetical protein